MNDLMRPALYGAKHKIIASNKIKNFPKKLRICRPNLWGTDTFAIVKRFQKLKEKDFVVICDVGAYGTSLASNYNIRPKPIEILIKKQKLKL